MEPVNLVLPNTTELKMKAISDVAEAVKYLSRALISTNVEVTISNNTISGAETGINISPPESA